MPDAQPAPSPLPTSPIRDDLRPQFLKERLESFHPLCVADIEDIQPLRRLLEDLISWYSLFTYRLFPRPHPVFVAERRELELIRANIMWKCSLPRLLYSDILLQIFAFVQEDAQYSLRNAKSTILRLAQVCRQWRNVAMSQRSLWVHISLSDGITGGHAEDHVARAVRFHLDRSGSMGLVVKIDGKPTGAHHALIAERHRWRVCVIPQNMVWYTSAQVASAPLYSSLERLELCQDGVGIHFSNAPRLRAYVGPIDNMVLPWQQLTSLTVTCGSDPHRLVEVLRLCSSLNYLYLDVAYFDSSIHPGTSALVPLYRLRHVVLRSRLGVHELRTLALFDSPALQILDICISEPGSHYRRSGSASDLANVLVDILSPSRALRTLGLRNIGLDRGKLHRVLASAQSVERLIWCEMEEDAYTLGILNLADVLSPSSHDTDVAHDSDGPTPDRPVLPRLSHLEINVGKTHVDPKLITRSIHLREVRTGEGKDAATRQEAVLEYSTWFTLDAHDNSELGQALRSLKLRKDA
ncbi:hypothetical protein FB107DRAFT_208043 [Schizophyllum commune]